MPNIRRTFPGRSVPVQNDDDDNDDEVGGEGSSSYHPGGGGKQFGKSLRPPTNDDDAEDDDDDDDDDDSEDDDDDDSDEDDEVEETKPTSTTNYAVRRSGKQLSAGAGKYLRPTNVGEDDEDDDDDDDDDEDAEVEQVVKIQPRPGGKNILRMARPDEDEEDDDDDDDDEVEEVESPTPVTYRVEGRGGGKSLSRMAPSSAAEDEDENSDDDDEDDEEEIVVQKVVAAAAQSRGKSIRQPTANDSVNVNSPVNAAAPLNSANAVIARNTPASGGKQLAVQGGKQLVLPRPPVESLQATASSNSVSRGPGGGKVLCRPHDDDIEDDKHTTASLSTISRGPGGGKTLRRLQDEDDNNDSERNVVTASVVARSPAGGKVLRRPDADEETKNVPPIKPTASIAARSPAGGKVLRRTKDEDEDHVTKPNQTIGLAATGGKQLNSSQKANDKEDDDEMDLDEEDEGDDDDDDDFEEKPSPPKRVSSRPIRAAAVKAAAKSKIDEETIGDEDRSLDGEEELYINDTEALIKDENDRKYLDSLPELEREAILGERFDKLKEKQDMQRAIAEARRKEKGASAATEPKSKRKAPATKDSKKKSRTEKDEDMARKLSGTRSSARSKDVSGAKSKKAAALAALKRQRKIQQDMEESSSDGSELDFGGDDEDSDEDYEEAELKPWQAKAKAADKSAAKPSTSRLDRDDGVDDSDMDVDDDDDEDEKVGTKSRARTKSSFAAASATDAGLDDFIKVTIPRRRLVQWCNEPFFAAAVLECFVRLFIGEDDNGVKVYRLCEIVDVKVDKRSYKFPVMNRNEKPVETNKFLSLKFGSNQRDFPMNLVSDTPPEELDVQKYLTTQKNNRSECLSKRRATKLRRTQDHLVTNYTYTTADIERSLMQRKKDGRTTSNLGSAQTKIAVAIKGAKDELHDAERRLTETKKALMEFTGASHGEIELEKKIEDYTRAVEVARKDLDELLQEEQETLDAVKNRTIKLTGREKDQYWAKVNRRAVQINQKADRESYKVQKEIDARKAAGEKEKFNPYARRKVKPKILWEVGQAKDDDEVKAENNDAALHSLMQDAHTEKAATPILLAFDATSRSTDAAVALISESHQFVIDEEGLAAQQSSANFHQDIRGTANTPINNVSRLRKGVTIAHYLQRKSLVEK